jgi:UDP-N-acetylglucosamine acyltransferase
MVGGQAHITRDVPPFVTVDGHSSQVVGLNLIGLRRNGFSTGQMQQLKAAYRVLYKSGLSWREILRELRETFSKGPAADIAPFLEGCRRGIVQERRGSRGVTLKLTPLDDACETVARRVA